MCSKLSDDENDILNGNSDKSENNRPIEEYKPKSGLGLRRITEEEAIKIKG